MVFCCSSFKDHYRLDNQTWPNFRIVKFKSKLLTDGGRLLGLFYTQQTGK